MARRRHDTLVRKGIARIRLPVSPVGLSASCSSALASPDVTEEEKSGEGHACKERGGRCPRQHRTGCRRRCTDSKDRPKELRADAPIYRRVLPGTVLLERHFCCDRNFVQEKPSAIERATSKELCGIAPGASKAQAEPSLGSFAPGQKSAAAIKILRGIITKMNTIIPSVLARLKLRLPAI
jgi:hypothetical protein